MLVVYACNEKLITEKDLKYFSFNFKNACCLRKMYLLPKFHKRLFEVSGRPVISNCGTLTESVRILRPPSLTCYERGWILRQGHTRLFGKT